MAEHSDGRTLSAIEDIIKGEVASRIQNLGAGDIIDMIKQREDARAIYDGLFSKLDGSDISRMIEAREDSSVVYTDLLKNIISKIDGQNQEMQERRDNVVSTASDYTLAITTASTQTDETTIRLPSSWKASEFHYSPLAPEENDQFHPTASISRDIVTPARPSELQPTAQADGNPGTCQYTTKGIAFEPQIPHLGIWAPTFMNKDQLRHIVRTHHGSRTTLRNDEVALAFIKMLNPSYLYYRVVFLVRSWNRTSLAVPKLNNSADGVSLWNNSDLLHIGPLTPVIIRAFAAVQCFNQHSEQPNTATEDDQPSSSRQTQDTNSSSEICKKLSTPSEFTNAADTKNWSRIKEYGKQLTSLMKDFGGESFLILFPIPEVLISIGIDETRIATYDRIWGHIRSILEKTEIGEFFRSLSGAVGDLLLTRFRGGASTGIVERLTSVLKEYSLEGVTPNSPTAYGFHLYLTPKLTPLAFCGKLDSLVHLSSDSSLRPKSLLELIDGTLSEDVVRHLIHQRLPRNWSVLGRAEISKAASRDLLLHNFEGIIIPLCIDHGWCFFCYVNPTRVDVTSPITFINPTGSSARFYTALFLLSKWIPEHESWVPKGVAVERVEVVKSQAACDRDSGIHVVLNAISMAESGKPETRLLDGGVCEALRVKYFVTMLNEMQEAVSKAAEKRKEG